VPETGFAQGRRKPDAQTLRVIEERFCKELGYATLNTSAFRISSPV
jgi:hypothetical protein